MTELADRHRRGIRYVLRTLARLKRIADKVPAKDLATALRPHLGHRDLCRDLRDYLGDVDECLSKLRPKRRCAECGYWLYEHARSDARYCSRSCRQKAYRKGVTARASPAHQAVEKSGRGGEAMSDTSFVTSPEFPDSCPTCGKTEGTYGIRRSRWGYCKTHKTKWIAGADMSAADEVTDEQRRRFDELENEIGLSEFKYVGPDAEGYERHKARNASERIMPAFVFARRRDIEREAGLILAGQLVVDIPKTKKPKRRHARMITEFVQGLSEKARSGRMPDDAVIFGWRNNFRPPNADEYIHDDEFMGAWAKTRLVIALRVDPRDDGIRIDSDLRRQLGLLH